MASRKTSTNTAHGSCVSIKLVVSMVVVLHLVRYSISFSHGGRSFVWSRGPPRWSTRLMSHMGGGQISPNSLANSVGEIARLYFTNQSVDSIQRLLVRKGVEFQHRPSFLSEYALTDNKNLTEVTNRTHSDGTSTRKTVFVSPLDKVPGCVANVYIRTVLYTTILNVGDGNRQDEYTSMGGGFIRVGGTADALVSRGLLAILAEAVYNQSTQSVLSMDAQQLTDLLQIRPALSPGRNDGLANMLRIIQGQIRNLLLVSSEAEQDQNINPPIQSTVSLDPPIIPATSEMVAAPRTQPTVALLLSGGVDSSVAMHLLLRQKYNVSAFYLKIWLEDEVSHLGECPWEDDFRTCQQVCEQVNVPLEAISLQDAYRERVITYTINEARQGRTPNPDVLCNSRIKFGCFYDAIAGRGFDYVATGHYAQIHRPKMSHSDSINSYNNFDTATEGVKLLRAPDPIKDQSYFLCALTQEQLQRVLFPIGHLDKANVRILAQEWELPNRDRPDSQGLCFLGKVKFDNFLAVYLGERPGLIVDAATGTVLGQHRGVWYHTVGQRKGIGKGLHPQATSQGPWYVVAKDIDRNVVYCSNQYDEDQFTAARSEFTVENIHWIAGIPPQLQPPAEEYRFDMKIRHGPRVIPGSLSFTDEMFRTGRVRLDRKDIGLAPGQYVVFYVGEVCLGGGVISERHWISFLERFSELVALATVSENKQ